MEAWLSSAAKPIALGFLSSAACSISICLSTWDSVSGPSKVIFTPSSSLPARHQFYRLPELMLKAFGNDRNIDFPSAAEPEPEPDPPSLGLSVPEALLPDEPQAASRLAVSMRIRANTESFS